MRDLLLAILDAVTALVPDETEEPVVPSVQDPESRTQLEELRTEEPEELREEPEEPEEPVTRKRSVKK